MFRTALALATAQMVTPLEFVNTSLATAAGFAPMPRPDAAPAGRATSVRTVTLVNLSGYVIRLMDYDGADRRHDLPPVGAVVVPRGEITFEVDLRALQQDGVSARFEIIGSDDQVLPHGYTLEITTEPLGGRAPSSPFAPEITELHLTGDDIVLRNATVS